MISVDTKKKENVGEFKNGGREWRPRGELAGVRTHDFPDEQLGKAIPYGVYDLAANAGRVSVGTDHDTAAFAVESIRRWWNAQGRAAYPRARRLLITADAGGSNGYRTRAWKAEIAALALQTGLAHGMSVRDILHHLRQVHGTELSPETVSRITDALLEEVKAWQSRPLDPVYAVFSGGAYPSEPGIFLI